jgi:hypothetical protein
MSVTLPAGRVSRSSEAGRRRPVRSIRRPQTPAPSPSAPVADFDPVPAEVWANVSAIHQACGQLVSLLRRLADTAKRTGGKASEGFNADHAEMVAQLADEAAWEVSSSCGQLIGNV